MFTLSLGGTYPGPPNTRRGTIVNPAAAAAVFPKNSLRETPLFIAAFPSPAPSPFSASTRFVASFNRFNSLIFHLAAEILPLPPPVVIRSEESRR
jgi:hypothetical protein